MLFGSLVAKAWHFRLCEVSDVSVQKTQAFQEWTLSKEANQQSMTWSFSPLCRYNFHSLWIKEQTQCKAKSQRKKGGFWRLLSFHQCSCGPTLYVCMHVCMCVRAHKRVCKGMSLGTGPGAVGNSYSTTIHRAPSRPCCGCWGCSEENIQNPCPMESLLWWREKDSK